MHHNWIPFGYGSRSCPGINLAMTELKIIVGTVCQLLKVIVGTVCQLLKVSPPKHHNQGRLDLLDVFGAAESSGHYWLRFEEP